MSKAVADCQAVTEILLDGDMRGVWLLTLINHWDLELERVVILCENTLIIFKYDFITLRVVHHNRIKLKSLSKAVLGEIVYPDKSLMPLISGIAGGVASIVRSVLFPKLHSTLMTIASKTYHNTSQKTEETDKSNSDKQTTEDSTLNIPSKKVSFSTPNKEDFTESGKLEDTDENCSNNDKSSSNSPGEGKPTKSSDTNPSKYRELPGLRLFTKQQPVVSPKEENNKESLDPNDVSWKQKWNPFCGSIPYHTLISHPLHWYTQGNFFFIHSLLDENYNLK